MEISGGNRPVDTAISTPGLDFRIISRPLDGAGGDVHYISVCGAGLITRILLADVAGHGATVAGLAGDLRKLIRRYINTKSQTRLLTRLNDRFEACSLDGLFATSMLASFMASTKRLTLCNAGHPRPLLYRRRLDAWELLSGGQAKAGNTCDLPLGIQRGTLYTQVSIDLEAGDRVILYTDLLIETQDRNGTPLGETGVLDIVRRLHCDNRPVSHALLEEILSSAGPHSPGDDVTILEFCHNGNGPRRPALLEKPLIYAKVFGLARV